MLYRVLKRCISNKPCIQLLNSKNSNILCSYYCSHQLNIKSIDNWTQIYKFRYIQLASAFSKLKIYQGALCTLGIPATFAFEQSSYLPDTSSLIVTSVGVTTLITLSLGSYVLNNLIGFVYLNDKGDRIRIAFIDFWGKRKHKEMVVDEMVSPMEIAQPKWNFYQPVTTGEKGATTFKLVPQLGIISYPEEFSSIFGE